MLRCSGGSVRVFEETRRSPTLISPSEGSRNPASSRSVVVLPQPDGPNRQTSCPWSIRKETSSTTASDPNRLVRPRKSTDANQCLPVLSHGSAAALGILIAFSSEVGTGSREENASKKDQSTKNRAAKRLQAPTLSPSHSIAASVPPLLWGMPSAFSPTSITPSVPRIIGALTW